MEQNRRTTLEHHKGKEINVTPQDCESSPRSLLGFPCPITSQSLCRTSHSPPVPVFNPSLTPQEVNSPRLQHPPARPHFLPCPPLSWEDSKPPNCSVFSPKTGTRWDFEYQFAQGKAGRRSHCHQAVSPLGTVPSLAVQIPALVTGLACPGGAGGAPA